ncbi:MAG TPA: hypothetical protein VJ349_25500, partial [Stellaceae bacterium]|nr:hypothetical protein [Stellaceae bacterium]
KRRLILILLRVTASAAEGFRPAQPGRGTPRKTFGGLDAHANSSAPVPLWTVELDGRIVLRVPHGRRTLARCVADRLRR